MADSLSASNRCIQIKRGTSVSDVLMWEHHEVFRIELVRDSSFQLFTEGVAIGKLSALTQSGGKPQVICRFDLENFEGDRLGVLDGLFGLSLLSCSISCLDNRGSDVRKDLLKFLWTRAINANGLFGDGKRLNILSRDPDYPVPGCLDAVGMKFPERRTFVDRLTASTAAISGSEEFGKSLTEEGAMTFLYESALNAYEHGRHVDGKLVAGVHGILIEKVVFTSIEKALTHHSVPEGLGDYLRLNWSKMGKKKMLVCFTVVDLGAGIQNTIEPLASEGEWGRFIRAFQEGVSQKRSSAGLSWGQGLPRLLEAGRKLKAFFYVSSAGVNAFRDFSAADDSEGCILEQVDFSASIRPQGTSLSLLWPVWSVTPDQLQFDFA